MIRLLRTSLQSFVALLAAALLLTVAACSSPNSVEEVFGDESGSVDAAEGEKDGPYVIGVAANFSGPLSYVGQAIGNGVTHATDVLNEGTPEGVNGREIEVKKCDTQFSTSTTINCITKLASQDEVDLIVADTPEGVTALGPEKVKALGVPVMLPALVPPGLDFSQYPNVVAMGSPITDSTDLEVMADFLATKQGKSRVGILAGNDEFFSAAGNRFADAMAAAGKPTVAREAFTFGDVDLSVQVRNLQKQNVDTIMCLGIGADCARAAQAMDRLGVDAQLAGTSALYMRAFRELAKNSSNDAVFTLPHSKTNDVSPAFVQWLFDYFRRYGFKTFQIGGSVAPDYPGLELPAYQAVEVIAKAAREAGSTATDKVLAALHRAEGFQSVGVTFVWPADSVYPTRDPVTEPWITRFRDGHISWDLDPRAVPALEDARIEWESKMFGRQFETDAEFIVAAVETFKAALEARKPALIAAEGQAKWDERIGQLDTALTVARQITDSGSETKLPSLGG